jgi:hypothetical protein
LGSPRHAQKKRNARGGCVYGGEYGLFFLLIYPDFKADGLVGRDELSLFFVPYLISLFSMTYAASRVLQRT